MKNVKIKKINKYYKNTYIIIFTIALYLFITIFKNMYFSLYNLKLSNLTNIEQKIATITYQIFAISISLIFLTKHKNDTILQLEKYTKHFIIGISTIIIYFLTSFIEIIILLIEKINIKNMTITSKTIYLILCQIMIISIITLINNKKLKKDFKDFKKNWKQYLEEYLIYYIIAVIIMIVSNLFINSLTKTIAGNEQLIQETIKKAPIYIFFSSVIAAPFLEEMVFRQSIKNIITNKTVFIITSGLIFGGLHVIGNINTIYDILYIIPYSTPGFMFAYILSKKDNIFIPISIHFIHNLLLITPQIIFLFI